MKLATRLVALLVVTLAALIAVDGYLEFREERALMRAALQSETRVLGDAMSAVAADVLRTRGMERCLQLIDEVNTSASEISVRLVWLDADPGDPLKPHASPEDVVASLATKTMVGFATADGAFLNAYFPMPFDAGRRGALELSRSTTLLSQTATRVLWRSITHLTALFLAAALTIYFIGVRLVGRPLSKLMTKVERVGEGDLTHPLVLGGRNELSQLAFGLNQMCERLSDSQAKVARETAAKIAAIDQARHADRLRTVGQLASGVAHELGTPLNVVGGRAALIAEGKLDPAQVTESAKIIGAQAVRMTGIIRQLLAFARRDCTNTERVNMAAAVQQSISLVQSAAKQQQVTLDFSQRTRHEPVVECNASALQQVLTNLIINAIQASTPGTTVVVEVGAEPAASPNDASSTVRPCVRVDVRDTGIGISNDQLARVFEPFFTTKDVGEGTGLGLSIVHGIVDDHDGWITAASKSGEGSCFTFFLPVSKP